MPWFSILPAHLTTVETWIIRFFLLLTLLTIGPWLLFLAYDILLYILRTIIHEIPYVGGRARGQRRPVKPTLEQRPGGGRRRVLSVSFGGGGGSGGGGGGGDEWEERDGEGDVDGDVDGRAGVRRRREMERKRGEDGTATDGISVDSGWDEAVGD